jgi:hypothetical protein
VDDAGAGGSEGDQEDQGQEEDPRHGRNRRKTDPAERRADGSRDVKVQRPVGGIQDG